MFAFMNPDFEVPVGVIGGSDGPTSIFIVSHFTPFQLIGVIFLVVVLLMNINVIRKR